MYSAIVARFKGPTEHNPSRLIVSANRLPRMVISYDKAQEATGNRDQTSGRPEQWAAQQFADKLEWTGKLIGGRLANGDYVFCFDR